jgi:hypothetical protein
VWWQYIIIAAVVLLGIYGFLTLTSFETRILSRRTTNGAADAGSDLRSCESDRRSGKPNQAAQA